MPDVLLAVQTAKKMSLAGAQHKMAVIYRDGQLFEPTGSEPSTHIIKPNHPDENWPHSVVNEWYVMKLQASRSVGTRGVPGIRTATRLSD
ncbi:MAG: HipA domain-containing protein [Pseudoalteromonas distincta]